MFSSCSNGWIHSYVHNEKVEEATGECLIQYLTLCFLNTFLPLLFQVRGPFGQNTEGDLCSAPTEQSG